MISRALQFDPAGRVGDGALSGAALGLFLSLLLGFAISESQLELLVLPMVAGCAWLFAARPVLALAVVVIGASSFALVGAWPAVSTPVGTASLADFLFLSAVAAGLIVSSRLEAVTLSAEGACLAILLVATALGIGVGISHGADAHDAQLAVREMMYYGAFWIARPLFSGATRRSLVLVILAAIAAGVVCIQVIQVLVGPSHTLFLVGSDNQVVNIQSDTDAFLRVRPPGMALVYIVCAFSAAYLISGPPRYRRVSVALLIITLVGIAFSLNRNMLLGLVAGLCVAALISANRTRVVAILAGAGVILLVTGAVLSTTGTGGNAVFDRVVSIGDKSQLDTGTLADRYYENDHALQQLERDPITGIGWGASYGATVEVGGSTQDRRYIHNQYLGIWLRAGLVGLLAIVVALLAGIRDGARASRAGGPDAWLGTGVIVALTAMAVSSAVGIYMMEAASIVPLAITLALAASLQPRTGHLPKS